MHCTRYLDSICLQTQFAAAAGLSVQFSVVPSTLIYEFVPIQQTGIAVFAQVASLLGTVLLLCKIVMNLVEAQDKARRRASSQKPAPANASDSAPKEPKQDFEEDARPRKNKKARLEDVALE